MLQDLHDRGIYLTEDEYTTGLRTLFPKDYQQFSDEELEDIIYQRIAQLSPSEAESLMEGFGSWLKKAASTVASKAVPVVTAALPTVAGAVGTAFGGPVGGAAAGFAGNLAAGAISKATKTKPNRFISNVGQTASSIASGNYRGAVPGLINVSRDVGNAISRGAGDKVARVASNAAQAATAIASGDYRGAVPGIINVGREVGNAVSSGAGNQIANVASNVAQTAGNNGAGLINQTQASAQLLSFLKSTPLLQSILSSIVTGSVGTGLQIPKEDGSATSTSYVEMLEALKHLTDNAIIEVDNAGFLANLQIESEAEGEAYIESIIEDVSNYENSLLPNYDVIAY